MADRRTDIIGELEKGCEDSITFFKSMTPEELTVQVYQDGAKWTAKQVLAHLITIEGSMQWLFKNISSGGSGSPENFDIEREDTISIVRELSEEDLDREGLHAFHGHGKLERFIRWAYEHARIHEEEIRRALG